MHKCTHGQIIIVCFLGNKYTSMYIYSITINVNKHSNALIIYIFICINVDTHYCCM